MRFAPRPELVSAAVRFRWHRPQVSGTDQVGEGRGTVAGTRLVPVRRVFDRTQVAFHAEIEEPLLPLLAGRFLRGLRLHRARHLLGEIQIAGGGGGARREERQVRRSAWSARGHGKIVPGLLEVSQVEGLEETEQEGNAPL